MKKKSKSIPPLLSCSNDILRRAVVAIRDSRGEVNTQTQLVLSLRNNLQKQLNNRINTLNQVCGAVIPQIRIELLPNPADIAESGDLRIIVSTNAAASYIITAEYFDSAKISHIVEVDLVHYEATVRAKQNVNAVYAVPSIKAVESICVDILTDIAMYHSWGSFATVYKGNIIKNLIMDCQSYTKYRPNETTGGIFVSWRRKEELPTGA